MKKVVIIVALVSALVNPFNTIVYAQSTYLRISPAKTRLTLSAGKTQTATIYVENATADTKTVIAEFRDSTTDASGTRVVAPAGQTNTADGMSAYLSGSSSLVLAAGERQSYVVTISIPMNVEPKTLYGGVAFTAQGDTGPIASLITATITAPEPAPSIQSTPKTNPGGTVSSPAVSPSSAPPASTSESLPEPVQEKKKPSTQKTTQTLEADRASSFSKQNTVGLFLILVLVLLSAGCYLWMRKRRPSATVEEQARMPQAPTASVINSDSPGDPSQQHDNKQL